MKEESIGLKIIKNQESGTFERWEVPAILDVSLKTGIGPQTKQQIEVLQKKAYEEGLKRGEKEGYAIGEALVNEKLAKLEKILKLFEEPIKRLDETIEIEIMELIKAISYQLLKREIKADPSHVLNIVKEAKSILPILSRNVQLYLHPDEVKIIRDANIIEEQGERCWTIIEDKNLDLGGCRIESQASSIDASLNIQLEKLFTRMLHPELATDNDEKAGEGPTGPVEASKDADHG